MARPNLGKKDEILRSSSQLNTVRYLSKDYPAGRVSKLGLFAFFLSCQLAAVFTCPGADTIISVLKFTNSSIPFLSIGFNMDSSSRVTAPIDQDRFAHRAPPSGSVWRDVFIYTSDDSGNLIGGLWVAEGITNANLYSMVEIFCIFSDTFGLHYPNGKLVERDQNSLQPGGYFLATNGRSPLCLSH